MSIDYAPWPEDYSAIRVAEMSHIAAVDDGKCAIWFVSEAGQKICLVAPLSGLNRALMQLQSDPLQTRPRLRVAVVTDR